MNTYTIILCRNQKFNNYGVVFKIQSTYITDPSIKNKYNNCKYRISNVLLYVYKLCTRILYSIQI